MPSHVNAGNTVVHNSYTRNMNIHSGLRNGKGQALTTSLPQPATPRGVRTRKRLLMAAEIEFGQNGYAGTTVASITARAKVGQGTFYLYFPSKEDALRELVRHMGRQLRRALTYATQHATSRLEAEELGLAAFIAFAKDHQNLYRVVMESQFVDETIYRDYYDSLAAAYQRNLEKAQKAGEICNEIDAESAAWAFMGVAHFFGLRYGIWQGGGDAGTAVATIKHLMQRGLAVQA